jgi:hypothetical protein
VNIHQSCLIDRHPGGVLSVRLAICRSSLFDLVHVSLVEGWDQSAALARAPPDAPPLPMHRDDLLGRLRYRRPVRLLPGRSPCPADASARLSRNETSRREGLRPRLAAGRGNRCGTDQSMRMSM